MTNKSLNDNYKNEEWMFLNKIDHEMQNEEFGIQKFEVGVLGVSTTSIDVFAQSSNVWA